MIVIFSDRNDQSTNKVMEYLMLWNKKVVRINKEDTVNAAYKVIIANNRLNIAMKIKGAYLDTDSIKSIWFRRGGLYFKTIKRQQVLKDAEILQPQLQDYFSAEQTTLNTLIYERFIASKTRVLGNPFLFNTRKLSVLRKAAFYGLNIPETIITTERTDIERFIRKKQKVITKAIQDNFTPVTSIEGYGLLTQTITPELLAGLPPTFFPSLFQEQVAKKYEIRSFFLVGRFYSIAIFSQAAADTAVDYRNYDYQAPNRIGKVVLPAEIIGKLKLLLKDLCLNTASIDMIYSADNRFIFLEINPVGQYDMVGKIMNFQLDKKIATWLAKN